MAWYQVREYNPHPALSKGEGNSRTATSPGLSKGEEEQPIPLLSVE